MIPLFAMSSIPEEAERLAGIVIKKATSREGHFQAIPSSEIKNRPLELENVQRLVAGEGMRQIDAAAELGISPSMVARICAQYKIRRPDQ